LALLGAVAMKHVGRGRGRFGREHRISAAIVPTAWAGALVASIVFGSLVLTATPAGASLTGACKAQGTLVIKGKTRVYNPKLIDKATVPRTGDVHWKASTGVAGDRAATGEVRVKFPPPIGKVVVGEWGKNGKKVGRPGNSGTYHYSLPMLIAGIKVPVSGEHHEPGINCFGAVVVSVQGRSPLAWVSVALTFACVMNLSFVMRAKRRVRP
jgi:hypothetical protein